MRRADRFSRRAGLTILEVIVSMGILLVGMTAILGILSSGAELSRTASLRAAGAATVEAIVADLEETFFPVTLDPVTGEEVVGEPADVEDRPVPNHAGVVYSARGRPAPDAGHGGEPLEYRVDIEISWSSGGRRRTRNFTTLLLREIPFGESLRRRFVRGAAK